VIRMYLKHNRYGATFSQNNMNYMPSIKYIESFGFTIIHITNRSPIQKYCRLN
jgi:hypothetical protein